MIPHPRNGQSVNDVFANRTEWMLLGRSRISFDGGECDKVGNDDWHRPSGHAAFRQHLWLNSACCCKERSCKMQDTHIHAIT
jgi:hypothetical protein